MRERWEEEEEEEKIRTKNAVEDTEHVSACKTDEIRSVTAGQIASAVKYFRNVNRRAHARQVLKWLGFSTIDQIESQQLAQLHIRE